MKTAGVVLDFYDDPTGRLLRNVFPKPEDLPEQIKTAHILNEEERGVLRDEAFAVVLANEGKMLRKFACVDPGNTLLSCLYFEQTAELLPEGAVKVAAANLAHFCEEFGFEPTNFVKMAAVGAQRSRDPLRQPIVGDEADWSARTNLVSVRGGADSGRVIPTANQMKTAEQKPTVDNMVNQRMKETQGYMQPKDEKEKEKEKKSASIEERMGGEKLTNDHRNIGVTHKQPPLQNKKHHPDGKINMTPSDGKGAPIIGENQESSKWPKFANVVDVTGKDPIYTVEKVSSARSALHGDYSLDSYADVQQAIDYFHWNWTAMPPADRHEYCVKTAARAEEIGLDIPDLMMRYGSTGYSPDVDLHLVNRQSVVDDEWKSVFQELKEKRASIDPEEFVKILSTIDEKTGLIYHYGGEVFDPYFATFGGGTAKMQKEAGMASWDWQNRVGDRVTAEQLNRLARDGKGWLKKTFSDEIVAAFQKDPISIFESLPEPQKMVISRLANDEFESLIDN